MTKLDRDIERWAVQSLPLTERTWRMRRYVLPRLAYLYRHCNKIDWTFATDQNGTGRVSALSDTDFGRNMHRLGFTWDEAQRISAWLSAQPNRMRELLQRLNNIGINATMDGVHRRQFLERIDGDLTAVALESQRRPPPAR